MTNVIKQTPATRDNTPKALKLTPCERHVASLESVSWSFEATVKRVLQAMETKRLCTDKLAQYFVGKTREEIKAFLLPHVAAFHGCDTHVAESSGKTKLSACKTYAKTAKALGRLTDRIMGEQNEHREALEASEGDETGEGKAKPTEDVAEPSEALIAAVAALVKKSGADKKTMAKAVAKAFALLK